MCKKQGLLAVAAAGAAAQQQRSASWQPTAFSMQGSAQQRASSLEGGSFSSRELNQEMQNRKRQAYQGQRSQDGGYSGSEGQAAEEAAADSRQERHKKGE